MKTLTHSSIILLVLIFSSCRKPDSDGLLVPEEIKPGRRDYIWTADTTESLHFNLFYTMWGNKDDNIWLLGGGDFGKAIWHYDGNKWSKMPDNSIDPTCVFGFDKNTVWIGSGLSAFWKNDGYGWAKTDELKMDKCLRIRINNIWGESPDNIYACGTAFRENNLIPIAVLMHYDGKHWAVVNTPEIEGEFIKMGKDIKGSGLYLIEYSDFFRNSSKVYTFDGTSLNEIYKGLNNNNESVKIYMLEKRVYILIGNKLFTYDNNKLQLRKDMNNTNFVGIVWGRNENDFFYVSKDNGIGHYNGKDFVTIFPDLTPRCAAVTENSAFFYTGYLQIKDIFLKGTLK